MPCNIGYKSYAKVEIPAPAPQTFTNKAEAPAIDRKLLEDLDIEDPEFLRWAKDLKVRPLLEEALKRVLKNSPAKGLDFTIDAKGMLEAKGRFVTVAEKRRLAERAAVVSERWQFEMLGIVAELLDYDVTIRQSGKDIVLEASEQGKAHPCNFIRVTREDGAAEIIFEHFKSRKAVEVETAKFVLLAHKLGVKIALRERTVHEGEAFPGSHAHPHAHPHNHRH